MKYLMTFQIDYGMSHHEFIKCTCVLKIFCEKMIQITFINVISNIDSKKVFSQIDIETYSFEFRFYIFNVAIKRTYDILNLMLIYISYSLPFYAVVNVHTISSRKEKKDLSLKICFKCKIFIWFWYLFCLGIPWDWLQKCFSHF